MLRTVPAHRLAATGLLVFPTLRQAMAAMPGLVAATPAAVELLDAESLRVAQTDPKADDVLRALAVAEHAALLIEWQESEPDLLAERERAAEELFPRLALSAPARLSRRGGRPGGVVAYPQGLVRLRRRRPPSGTTALLEDVAVPVPALADLCDELIALFAEHRYERQRHLRPRQGRQPALHAQRALRHRGLERYADFTEDMVRAVLARGGTLKAEHGTGRVMAPFVRRQYGEELYGVMREVKRLCDPAGALNPGVVLTDRDRRAPA